LLHEECKVTKKSVESIKAAQRGWCLRLRPGAKTCCLPSDFL